LAPRMTLDNILSRGLALQPNLGIGNHPVDPPGEVWDKRQRITGHGSRGFKRFSESQATVDVATTAITNRKTTRAAPEITHNAAAYEYQCGAQNRSVFTIQSYLTVARPTQADLRGSGTSDQKRHLAVARPTQGRLTQFGRCLLHNLTVARPTKGRLAQFSYTEKTNDTSTKKIPQVNKIQSTVKAHCKTTPLI
ncbi:Uncharacterized protein FWK35_00032290, partial [Aphis craccivora]